MRIGVASGVSLGIVAGLAIGLGLYTFVYAKGYSYLTNDPRACANCHVMEEQFSGWVASSHRSAATCNDCHTPHDFLGKYATKASNGLWHSFYFTTQRFHEPIRMNARNRRVTEGACRHCHGAIVDSIDRLGHGRDALQCLTCHRNAGHLH